MNASETIVSMLTVRQLHQLLKLESEREQELDDMRLENKILRESLALKMDGALPAQGVGNWKPAETK
jgi:hypothetical protein